MPYDDYGDFDLVTAANIVSTRVLDLAVLRLSQNLKSIIKKGGRNMILN